MTDGVHDDQVTAAANAWLWVPDDATAYDEDGCLLVRFAEHYPDPVVVLRTDRLVDVDAVLARAAGQGADHLVWWVKLDAPGGLEAALVARGGALEETLDVLARPLSPGDPPVAVPDGLELRWQVDLPTRRDGYAVGVAVFGGRLPADDLLSADLALRRAEVGQGEGGGLNAYVDGRPVGTGGVAVVDGVARLWGGGVVEAARRRGVYAALLAERLAYATRAGATLALVKGRVQTSGPILRRAGFTAYGQERSYRFEL